MFAPYGPVVLFASIVLAARTPYGSGATVDKRVTIPNVAAAPVRISPLIPGYHCQEQGTVPGSYITVSDSSTDNYYDCHDECWNKVGCISFGYNACTNKCIHFNGTLDSKGFRKSITSGTYYWNLRHCFKIDSSLLAIRDIAGALLTCPPGAAPTGTSSSSSSSATSTGTPTSLSASSSATDTSTSSTVSSTATDTSTSSTASSTATDSSSTSSSSSSSSDTSTSSSASTTATDTSSSSIDTSSSSTITSTSTDTSTSSSITSGPTDTLSTSTTTSSSSDTSSSAPPPPTSTDIIQNGSFEDYAYDEDGDEIDDVRPPWDISGASGFIGEDGSGAHSGESYLIFTNNAMDGSGLTQTLNADPASTYTLTFYYTLYSSHINQGSCTLTASLDGVPVAGLTPITVVPGSPTANFQYSQATATGIQPTSATPLFSVDYVCQGVDANSYSGFFLDDFSLVTASSSPPPTPTSSTVSTSSTSEPVPTATDYIQNGGFETDAVDEDGNDDPRNRLYWQKGSNSAFFAASSRARSGDSSALLANSRGKTGAIGATITQTLAAVDTTSTYTLTFYYSLEVAQIHQGSCTLTASLDGVPLTTTTFEAGTFPSNNVYSLATASGIQPTSTDPLLSVDYVCEGVDSNSSSGVFVDDFSFVSTTDSSSPTSTASITTPSSTSTPAPIFTNIVGDSDFEQDDGNGGRVDWTTSESGILYADDSAGYAHSGSTYVSFEGNVNTDTTLSQTVTADPTKSAALDFYYIVDSADLGDTDVCYFSVTLGDSNNYSLNIRATSVTTNNQWIHVRFNFEDLTETNPELVLSYSCGAEDESATSRLYIDDVTVLQPM